MKFKYYLRGAGIGVIVTTIILTVAFLFHKNTMSDAEVIERAIELGMVMDDSTGETLASVAGDHTGTKVDLETVVDEAASETDSAAKPGQSADTKEEGDKAADGKAAKDASKGSESDSSASGSDASNNNASEKADSDTKASSDTSKAEASTKNQTDSSKQDAGTDDQTPETASAGETEPETVTITINSGDVSRIVANRAYEAGLVESAEEFNDYLGAHGYDKNLHAGTYEIRKDATYRQIAKILTTKQE